MGTTGYMSPEQALGENIDERSDVFSLGVVLYEMVAGQPPFKGKTDSHTRVSIIDHDPVPLVNHVSNVPRQFERIVSKALAKDRLKRYQTITDLKSISNSSGTSCTLQTPLNQRDKQCARRKRTCIPQYRRP